MIHIAAYHWRILMLMMLCLSSSCYVLDDFTARYYNQIGELRFGVGKVQVNVTYPRYGISIPTEKDYLVEVLKKIPKLRNPSLKLEYTAFTPGTRNIKLYGRRRGYRVISVSMHKGRNVVVIPFPYFTDWSIKEYSGAIAIGGPLFVHRLELIDAGSTEHHVMPKQSVLYAGYTPIPPYPDYSGACLRQKESPPHRQFVEYWDHKNDVPFININSRGFRRGGFGISKAHNGISIEYGGFLFQNLVDEAQEMDLSDKVLQLSLSTLDHTPFPVNGPTGIDIKIQYRQDSVIDGGVPHSSMYTLMVPNCNVECFDIRFSAFPEIRYQDVKTIWIYGPVTIHHIKLVSRLAQTRFYDSKSESDSSEGLVDDLSTWPDSLDHSNMVTTLPAAEEDYGLKHGSGLNALNYPCYGTGVYLGDGGIEMSDDGFIYEQLASRNGIYDLSHATLEIKYSAEEQITRTLQVDSVIPDNTGSNYHIQPVKLGLLFTEGKQKTLSINLCECGLSNALSILGHGIVTLHQMSLRVSLLGQPQLEEVLDDFADWPLLHDPEPIFNSGSISTQFGQTSLIDETVHYHLGSGIYDFRQIRHNVMPVLIDSTHVVGCGVEIRDGGQLIQPLLPGSATSNMIITYSAAELAPREITFAVVQNDMIIHRDIVVPFSTGESLQVVVNVPYTDAKYESHIAAIIDGPLTVHQVEFVDNPDLMQLLPGLRSTNALFIDNQSLRPKGLGTVILHGQEQYLIEGFPQKWNSRKLYDLSFRITYTLDHNAVCRTSLITKPLNTMLGRDNFDALLLQYVDIELDAGVNVIFTKPLQDVINGPDGWNDSSEWNDSVWHPAYHGLVINGPTLTINNLLIIHQFEFILKPEYLSPMMS